MKDITKVTTVQHILQLLVYGPARYAGHHHVSLALAPVIIIGALVAECVAIYLLAFILIRLAVVLLALRHHGFGHCKTEECPWRLPFLHLSAPSKPRRYVLRGKHVQPRGDAG